MLPRPHALLLDLDQTLLDHGGAREAAAQTCESLVFAGLNPQELQRANLEVWQHYWPEVEQRCWLGQMDGYDISREAWRRTLQTCGCTDEAVVQQAFQTHRKLNHAAYRLYDDAAELLRHAAQSGLRLALVTNGSSELQRDKLAALGLAETFDTVVVSGEIGVAKPDPAPFLLALRQLGVEPTNAWHIGDSLATDVAGARAAGAVAVWLNRDGSPASPLADLEIATLTDLLDKI